MAGYSKELIVNVFLDRFISAEIFSNEEITSLRNLAEQYYDKVGKDSFRVAASVTPEAIKLYKGKHK